MSTADTIAAIATPIGTSGIGVIRISGPQALDVADKVFRTKRDSVKTFPSHTAHHGKLVNPSTGEPIDDIVLTVFRAPRSYTGEDVVELSCHGGIAVLKTALNAVLQSGARLAEPGEFTKRAFLNGKIDLAQAEAVNDLIRAKTDKARRVALSQLDGALSLQVRAARDRILGVLAAVEAAIDFPEDVDEPDPCWLESEITSVRCALGKLMQTFSTGRIYREGVRVVITGRVNVGKSSLLNALLRHARAIVTPIPGTTRDVIEECLEIKGIPIVAIDTAGLRPTQDPVEQIGVELAQRTLQSADLALLVIDASQGVLDTDAEILRQLEGRPAVVVVNKIDLVPPEEHSLIVDECRQKLGPQLPVVLTSALGGLGIEDLENTIADVVEIAGISDAAAGETAVVSNIRHQQALGSALDSLDQALATLRSRRPIDLLSVDLTAARDALGLITGETATEDLLERIFSEFCIGK
ncbi:MAG: tRNA uridine-5-carboxymethylaminomethyl(34) synthesis GTPase MnmE [Armatimonadota bacterium]|nr:tRNA uridine-5-carboxymethylaminomethyl(34) synthesis GTPase MnmE [Armatimonadota bacterium]